MSAPIGGTPVKVRGLISLAWLQRGDTTTIVWDATAVELVNAGYLEILEVLPVDPGEPAPTVAQLQAAVVAAEQARDEAVAARDQVVVDQTALADAVADAEDARDAALGHAGTAQTAAGEAQTWAAAAEAVVIDQIPNASASTKGGLRLTGDLGGTWDAPTVPGLTGKQSTSERNQPNGYAGLDGSGLVPAVLLPSYVDDVLEHANLAGFPATGSVGKIYVALDTGRIYRWSGSAYVEISASPGSTDAVPEGSANLYFTDARAQAATAAAIAAKYTKPAGGIPAADLAAAVQTSLGKADTAIQPGSQPYDVTFVAQSGTRKTGAGDVPLGLKIKRPTGVVFSEVTFRCETADASGNLVVEVRKNGSATGMPAATIAAASQVAGVTVTGPWSFADGDVLTVHVTGVGTTPGKGLVADFEGLA
ncbi:hypothetical protein LZP97_00075 [Rhodococcus sp. DMF-1]|uniref:hypothetical protein n=1 Tax=Rhodococcus TaxID=1827 RepID=UPI000B272F22|nr:MULTISPECIES: hypothetical protein [Rhodococcus]UIR37009.1 hypothetical protein LZP97_00075 [Rhodococcus sp. DMF-1]